MRRPDDIPQDVWDLAEEPAHVCFDGAVDLYETGLESSNLQLVIARAILAAKAEEREACALIADRYVDSIDIAHFIRKRGEG